METKSEFKTPFWTFFLCNPKIQSFFFHFSPSLPFLTISKMGESQCEDVCFSLCAALMCVFILLAALKDTAHDERFYTKDWNITWELKDKLRDNKYYKWLSDEERIHRNCKMIKRAFAKMDNPPKNCTEPNFVRISGVSEFSVGFPLKGLRCGETFELAYTDYEKRPLPQLEDSSCGMVTHVFGETHGYGPWIHVFQGVATADMPWFINDSTGQRMFVRESFCHGCDRMDHQHDESFCCKVCRYNRIYNSQLIVV